MGLGEPLPPGCVSLSSSCPAWTPLCFLLYPFRRRHCSFPSFLRSTGSGCSRFALTTFLRTAPLAGRAGAWCSFSCAPSVPRGEWLPRWTDLSAPPSLCFPFFRQTPKWFGRPASRTCAPDSPSLKGGDVMGPAIFRLDGFWSLSSP
jgi:hypothetical protein